MRWTREYASTTIEKAEKKTRIITQTARISYRGDSRTFQLVERKRRDGKWKQFPKSFSFSPKEKKKRKESVSPSKHKTGKKKIVHTSLNSLLQQRNFPLQHQKSVLCNTSSPGNTSGLPLVGNTGFPNHSFMKKVSNFHTQVPNISKKSNSNLKVTLNHKNVDYLRLANF